MKLDKPEKIQLVYDTIGAFFCALSLAVICSWFLNPSSNPQTNRSKWEYFHIFPPFVFYGLFTYLFWKLHSLKQFRLSLLWLIINLFASTTTLFFSFFIRDIVNNRFLTEKSKFIPFDRFLSIVGGVFFGLSVCAFFFWVFGRIHRTLVENRSRHSVINLEIR